MSKLNKDLESTFYYRPFKAEDVSFLLDTWIRGFRESPWAGISGNHVVFDRMHADIEGLLERGSQVTVAASRVDPDRILGYVVWEPVKGGTCVHYLYVKDAYRQLGLGSDLLREAERNVRDTQDATQGRFYTCRTRDSAYFPGWVHRPEIARRKSA